MFIYSLIFSSNSRIDDTSVIYIDDSFEVDHEDGNQMDIVHAPDPIEDLNVSLLALKNYVNFSLFFYVCLFHFLLFQESFLFITLAADWDLGHEEQVD